MEDFDALLAKYETLLVEGEYDDYEELWENVRETARKIRLEFSEGKPEGIHLFSQRYHQVIGSTPMRTESTQQMMEKMIAAGLTEAKVSEITDSINRAVEERVGALLVSAELQ